MKAPRSDAPAPKSGPAKEFFANGTLSAAGAYLNGRKTGTWKYFFHKGLLKAVGK